MSATRPPTRRSSRTSRPSRTTCRRTRRTGAGSGALLDRPSSPQLPHIVCSEPRDSRGAAIQEALMKVGYVVLYVNDADTCRSFWIDQIGMVEKRRTEAGVFTIAQVGFADQPF